jgi:hypothetical protein
LTIRVRSFLTVWRRHIVTTEEPLAGLVSAVVRVGYEVRRELRPTSPAVHALLRHLEQAGFDGAPRFLGIDDKGRERLTFAEGETYLRATRDTIPDRTLPSVGQFIRRYHDAVDGFVLPDGLTWFAEAETGVPSEYVICHNDISPRNIVFRGGQPVTMIDWDLAYPAPRVWDVAHAVWQFVPTLADRDYRAEEWSGIPSREERLHRLRQLVDGYGLTTAQRTGFADVLARRIDRTSTGIRALAAEGHPVFVGLVTDGTIEEIDAARDWVVANAGAIQAAVE